MLWERFSDAGGNVKVVKCRWKDSRLIGPLDLGGDEKFLNPQLAYAIILFESILKELRVEKNNDMYLHLGMSS